MGKVLDLILIGIILLAAWRGFRAGFINGICGILAVIVAVYGGNLISNTYSSEFTDMLEPFVSGVVESVEGKVIDSIKGEGSDSFVPVYDLSQVTESDVGGVCIAVMRQLGISEGSAEKLSEEITKQADEVNSKMLDALTALLCERIAYIALFAISFLLIIIIFTAVGNILDLAFGLPGLENINHILGGVFGAAKGILIVLVITCVCRYMGILLKTDLLEGTIIMKRLIESNFIANLLQI